MNTEAQTFESRLISMVRSSPVLMELLRSVRELELASWCIGAGAVRSLVWDRLHGFAAPADYDDVDVVYYDGSDEPAQEARLLGRLLSLKPSVRWEMTNQATVHRWFASHLSQVVAPVNSLSEGVATWPEYATCVGVSLGADDGIEIIAPYGLDDLFSLRLRHNPLRASAEVFQQRIASKRFAERWPLVSIVSA